MVDEVELEEVQVEAEEVWLGAMVGERGWAGKPRPMVDELFLYGSL